MNADKLRDLQIDPGQKRRPQRSMWTIFIGVALVTGAAAFFAWPRTEDEKRVVDTRKNKAANEATKFASTSTSPTTGTVSAEKKSNTPTARSGDSVLTVSGYIIARERIELSPRFMGVVKWIGVKKGDAVTNSQVVVLLDDAEYKARLLEVDGRMASANVTIEKAQIDYDRASKLTKEKVESKQLEDDTRLRLDSAKAAVKEINGARALVETYIDWCVIRSPINGVVLEKLVDPNELVVPQSFGGARGPSTALIALADLKDLQVEVDLSERDLAKVSLSQKCRVSPEA
jgi:RND family efflux transporter MFP subunit